MPKVINLRDTIAPGYKWGRVPLGAIRVDRNSKWGNPFKIGKDGDRAHVVALYEEWLHTPPMRKLLSQISELRGRDLACWCAPEACHADVLLKLANKGKYK